MIAVDRDPDGHLPGVLGGVVCAFPCPSCKRWCRPITSDVDDLMECLRCKATYTYSDANAAYRRTVAFMAVRSQ